MNNPKNPLGVTLSDGASILTAVDGLIEPFDLNPENHAAHLLNVCIQINPQAVLSCQGRTRESAMRVLRGGVALDEFFGVALKSSNKSIVTSAPISLEEETGEVFTVPANDVPIEGEEWMWEGSEAGD